MKRNLRVLAAGGVSYAALGLAIIAGCHAASEQEKAQAIAAKRAAILAQAEHTRLITRLAGPYAKQVVFAAQQFHVRPCLVASVLYVENGGNFAGSAHRISSAGAIGFAGL